MSHQWGLPFPNRKLVHDWMSVVICAGGFHFRPMIDEIEPTQQMNLN